jgi:hypothetical protein
MGLFNDIDPIFFYHKSVKPLLAMGFNGVVTPSGVRGSYDRNQGVKALHLVTAWASEQRLVLGQVKVEDHSNEITAIPALLELLDLTGAIVTLMRWELKPRL